MDCVGHHLEYMQDRSSGIYQGFRLVVDLDVLKGERRTHQYDTFVFFFINEIRSTFKLRSSILLAFSRGARMLDVLGVCSTVI
jgi:hypothetical protein